MKVGVGVDVQEVRAADGADRLREARERGGVSALAHVGHALEPGGGHGP